MSTTTTSSRSCANCRAARKACDRKKPHCTRCVRLGYVCPTSEGNQWIFKKPVVGHKAHKRARHAAKPNRTVVPVAKAPEMTVSVPSSQSTRIACDLIHYLEVTDVRYTIISFGEFLRFLPQRVETNTTLEIAVDAFTTAFREMDCEQKSPTLLRKYGQALSSVRHDLQFNAESQLVNLSCSIFLLLLTQIWMGQLVPPVNSHHQGLAHLVEVLAQQETSDEMQRRIILDLCTPVVVASITDQRVRLSPRVWQLLKRLSSQKPTTQGTTGDNSNPSEKDDNRIPHALRLQVIARLQYYLNEPEIYYKEIRSWYTTSKTDISLMWQRVYVPCSKPPQPDHPKARPYRDGLAAVSLMLSIAIILNRVLEAFFPGDSALRSELYMHLDRIIWSGNQAVVYRPIGTGFMTWCLSLCLSVADDPVQKEAIHQLLLQRPSGRGVPYPTDKVNQWRSKFAQIKQRLSVSHTPPGD